ncbi:hypothetical protein [Corynebacterium cystitidis]|uniref:hypothetical protein n=1 Tax=Corynebacterium cystitidis TaxID=35757 RepID=UPI00211E61F0|nr:hypothetical protein [Corynebacterium cystitidis]
MRSSLSVRVLPVAAATVVLTAFLSACGDGGNSQALSTGRFTAWNVPRKQLRGLATSPKPPPQQPRAAGRTPQLTRPTTNVPG